jgi:hypothetical protein
MLHIIGGGFWAGINLCMNNLLLRISHQQNRAFFLSLYHIAGGSGASTAPVLAGSFLTAVSQVSFNLFTLHLVPIHIILLISTLMRLLSFQIIKRVHEPEEVGVSDMVRGLRSIRGLNLTNGFNNILHPFIAIEKENRDQT